MFPQSPHPQATMRSMTNDTETDAPSAESAGGGDDDDGGDDDYEPDKTFISIHGVHPSDVKKEHKEQVERAILDTLLPNGYPIEGVVFASDDRPIVEVQVEDA